MPICHVCRILLVKWADAQRFLCAAEGNLVASQGADAPEFQALNIALQDARLECDIARLEFEKHRRDHANRTEDGG